ncbi:unnamed protein product, partial [Mesorhabditis belari]|uniref:Uncharacterized protein n=1 Tax=Mesorhabditis belari TaxID=2138241 RepID=A0AAF3EST0_9BILA
MNNDHHLNDYNFQSTVTVTSDEETWVQINGLFPNYSNTSFTLISHTLYFDQTDVKQNGGQGLRLQVPIVIRLGKNSTKDFYLSFAIIPGENETALAGFDDYNLNLFDEKNSSLSPYYLMSSLVSNSTSTMLTIINQKYSKEDCHEFVMQSVQIDPKCILYMYAGASPTTNSEIDAVSDSTNYVFPILSGPYYTFLLKPQCSTSFYLLDRPKGSTAISPSDKMRGSVVSCEFPGTTFSRKEPVKPFQQVINGTGLSTYPITASAYDVYPGDSGSLSFQILEQNAIVASMNVTNNTRATTPINGVGHVLSINYTPKGIGNQGFLMKWLYEAPTTEYFSIDNDPLILRSRFQDTRAKQILASGLNIQVNVKILSLNSEVYFSDATQRYSLSDLAKSPRIFQNYVHISENPPTNQLMRPYIREAVPSEFLAAFTSFANGSYPPALADYTLINVLENVTTTIVVPAKNNTQAVTISQFSNQLMFFGNVNKSAGSSVTLYVSGIPQTVNKMRIYSFDDSNVQGFVRSLLMSPAATLIVPPNCYFSADITRLGDDMDTKLKDGSNGFVMTPNYPGNYDNYLPFMTGKFVKATLSSDTSVQTSQPKFTVTVPYVQPGLFAGVTGNLSISVTDNKNAVDTLKIDQEIWNKTWTGNGYKMEILWLPVTGQNSFLLNYRMDLNPEKSSTASPGIFSIFALILAQYL